MKIRTFAGALCAILFCTPVAISFAQPADTAERGAPSGRPGKPPWKKYGQPGGPMPGLPPEEAQRLAAAREKAKDDPTVRSLREAREAVDRQLESAMNASILAADPGLAPVLEKVKQSRERAKAMRDRFESLTPEQREQLKSARQAAKDDPEVVSAREKIKSAASPEARREAVKAMRGTMRAAMLKQNPDLAPLLDQLGPQGRPMGGPGGPMGPPPGMADDFE